MNNDHQPESSLWQFYSGKSGWKHMPSQFSSFPYIGHLIFADKKDLPLPGRHEELNRIVHYLADSRNKYRQFLRQKSRYPSYDLYACLQPFNEAFKALYPFVAYIAEHLEKGDMILNLWDRSGWTASMLAGWFPEQHVVTVWEGDKDILGYRGFDYWMSTNGRKNHTVLFTDFNKSLPLDTHSVAAVVGLDLLHRYDQSGLLAEINRVAKKTAPVVFPHVHLTNSMPDPFFERGCRQLHGTDYQHLFDKVASFTKRIGYILSEPATFLWNDTTTEDKRILVSEPANSDYNACIAWLPAKTEPPVLHPWRGHEQKSWQQMYLLQNPLLTIDALTQKIRLREEGWGENVRELLGRHPVYAKRIEQGLGKPVEENLSQVLYWASQGLRLQEIMDKTGISKDEMQRVLLFAWETDLGQLVPVDEAGFRLQTLLGQQKYIPEMEENQLAAFWQQKVALFRGQLWCALPGETALTYEQADELVQLVQKGLAAAGLNKGDKILLCGSLHPEQLLVFWAAVSMGVVVVPLSSVQACARISEYLTLIQPALALTDPSLYTLVLKAGCPQVIMTDQHSHPDFQAEHSFEAWLEQALEREVQFADVPQPEDIAVLLWTTGSTGNPKGIPLTHAQLIRSGRVMTETYHWKNTDRYYGLGGLETMSGLRHATVGIAEVGAACIIPSKVGSIYDHLETIRTEKTTILTANPAFYRQLMLAVKTNPSGGALSVRLALCTGNQLSRELRETWRQATGIQLYNYYGLTETGGICIAEHPGVTVKESNSIGLPVDCLVKILDEDGNRAPVGIPGELCIYGVGVFQGYYGNPDATGAVMKNGWFHTGDLAVQHADGSLSLCGRISDIIKLPCGSRIEVSAIEEVLQSMTGLKDWAVCPVREWEKEYIAIFLVPEPGNNGDTLPLKIRETISNKIGSFAAPSLIELVPSIPRGNHNKVLRKELLDQYFQQVKSF